jgi:hypothetical protein
MGAKIQAFDIFQTPLSSHYPLPLMCNLYFMSLFISIWKTGVENNTRAQCPLPFCICCVQYKTVVQYNIEAALWTIFTLQTSFAGGGGGGGEAMSSWTVLHSCHPVTYKCYK